MESGGAGIATIQLVVMKSEGSGFGGFVEELRRRRVVRVALAYLAGAFVILQLGEIILPAFSASDAGLRILVVVCALGFPVAVVLGWIYDITPAGIRRTEALEGDRGGTPAGGMLPRIALLAVTLGTVGSVGWWWLATNVVAGETASRPAIQALPASTDDIPIRSLAVLPLEDFAPEGTPDYFTAGMHEAIIAQLSQLQSFRVVSRTSVMRFAGANQSIAEIGRELGVEGIIEGSVLRDEDRVRITVQLIHAPSDRHLWTENYERELTDIIQLQSEVAQDIARQIQGQLTPDEEEMFTTASTPADPQVQETLMRARFEASKGTEESLRTALDLFEDIIDEDPAFAPAHSGWASSRLLLAVEDPSTSDTVMQDVEASAQRAMVLDANNREAREVMAVMNTRLGEPVIPAPGTLPLAAGDIGVSAPAGAAPAGATTVVVTTDSTLLSQEWTASMSELGRRVERRMGERPGFRGVPNQMVRLARQLREAGDPEAAIAMLDNMVTENPDAAPVLDALEHLHVAEGDWEAVVDLQRRRIDDTDTVGFEAESLDDLSERLGEGGAEVYWEWRWTSLQGEVESGERISHVDLAAALTGLGRLDEALVELEQAFQQRDRHLIVVATDPTFDPLRSRPEFRELTHRLRGRPGRSPRPGDPRSPPPGRRPPPA